MKVILTVCYNPDIEHDGDEGKSLIEFYYPPHIKDALIELLGATSIKAEAVSSQDEEE